MWLKTSQIVQFSALKESNERMNEGFDELNHNIATLAETVTKCVSINLGHKTQDLPFI